MATLIVSIVLFLFMEMQERIASKAEELFLRYGIRSISMDEIASQLGISKKTIYQFYADKDALVQNVIETILTNNECACRNTTDISENPVHEFFVALGIIQDLLGAMNPAFIYDIQKYHPLAYKRLTNYQQQFLLGVVVNNLEEGRKLLLYRDDFDIDILARFRFTSIFMLFDAEMSAAMGKHKLTTIMEEITIHFLYGIATPKGQKLIHKYQNR